MTWSLYRGIHKFAAHIFRFAQNDHFIHSMSIFERKLVLLSLWTHRWALIILNLVMLMFLFEGLCWKPHGEISSLILLFGYFWWRKEGGINFIAWCSIFDPKQSRCQIESFVDFCGRLDFLISIYIYVGPILFRSANISRLIELSWSFRRLFLCFDHLCSWGSLQRHELCWRSPLHLLD